MITYAIISRTNDGLPLSASTDANQNQSNFECQEARKYLKILAKQLGHKSDVCTVKMYSHSVHFISCFGISYLAMCEGTYPAVLAFSFLNDIQREFVSTFDMKQINNVIRPYAFIEFDSIIQKLRQKYNNPRTLTTKVSLTEMSAELAQNPPKQYILSDIIPNSMRNGPVLARPGCHANLLPMSFFSVISLIFITLSSLLSIYRGISAISVSTLEEYEGTSPYHGLSFLLEALCGGIQATLLLANVKYRVPIAWVSFSGLILCNLAVWQLQDSILTAVNLLIASAGTVAILSLTPSKNLNYNV